MFYEKRPNVPSVVKMFNILKFMHCCAFCSQPTPLLCDHISNMTPANTETFREWSVEMFLECFNGKFS